MSIKDFTASGGGYEWMLDGECVHYPSEMFFPEAWENSVAALTVCASCDDDIKMRCLEFALVHAPHGVWGGMSEKQRAEFRRELLNAKEQTDQGEGA